MAEVNSSPVVFSTFISSFSNSSVDLLCVSSNWSFSGKWHYYGWKKHKYIIPKLKFFLCPRCRKIIRSLIVLFLFFLFFVFVFLFLLFPCNPEVISQCKQTEVSFRAMFFRSPTEYDWYSPSRREVYVYKLKAMRVHLWTKNRCPESCPAAEIRKIPKFLPQWSFQEGILPCSGFLSGKKQNIWETDRVRACGSCLTITCLIKFACLLWVIWNTVTYYWWFSLSRHQKGDTPKCP